MGALANLKILDFTTLIPGPFATMMMGDMGADILKVESPTRVDLVRAMGPFNNSVSTCHSFVNRNKKSISLDLKKEKSVEIVKRLIMEYDIVIEQFRPGVMKRPALTTKLLKRLMRRSFIVPLQAMVNRAPIKIEQVTIITTYQFLERMATQARQMRSVRSWVCQLQTSQGVHYMR